MPPMLGRPRPEWVVTRLTLGVPRGAGVAFPPFVARMKQMQDKHPAEVAYVQVLHLDPPHGCSVLSGRMVPPKNVISFVESHMPKLF